MTASMGRTATAIMALALAGCTAVPTPQAPPPRPEPAPAPTPAPPPPPAARSWEDRAVDPGAWRYDAGGRSAVFVQSGRPAPLLTMTCSGGGIRLTSGLEGNVTLRTSAGTDQIRFDGGAASVPARDVRLDRIAFSRGRFALESPSGALTLPVQSEIGRVIEDCRG
ncbi:MAG: hypothetical protein DI569_04565 [Sphingopyxis macrogoltabida]|uniref:Lipoprotein n=1 Tax=Sphingopyxis macrogoltabida TaxID=33050 RepID=A0A2W5N004_SPHMC|nr:MAG: hypothetical protein DI569_04565 [Sphingopyxis macrogoltabida]